MKKYNVQLTTTITEAFIVEAECDMDALETVSGYDEDDLPLRRSVERKSLVAAVEGFTAN